MLGNLKYTERNVSRVTAGQWSVTDCELAKYVRSVTHERAADRQKHEHCVTAVGCLHLSRSFAARFSLIDPEQICQRLER